MEYCIYHINIERKGTDVKVNVFAAKPGMIIGKGGAAIDEIRKKLEKLTTKNISLNIVEVKDVDLDATLVAEQIASALEKRISFRKAMKQAIANFKSRYRLWICRSSYNIRYNRC